MYPKYTWNYVHQKMFISDVCRGKLQLANSDRNVQMGDFSASHSAFLLPFQKKKIIKF